MAAAGQQDSNLIHERSEDNLNNASGGEVEGDDSQS